MQYFIFSDVHSNLEALTTCLIDYVVRFNPDKKNKEKIQTALEKQNISLSSKFIQATTTDLESKIVCLGDTIGYGPNPNECLEIVTDIADVNIIGNHEHYVYTSPNCLNAMNSNCWRWYRDEIIKCNNWHRLETLLNESLYHQEEGNLVFSHGLPINPKKFYYYSEEINEKLKDPKKHVNKSIEFLESPQFSSKICFIGHSHKPMFHFGVNKLENIFFYNEKVVLPADNHERVLVSVPSVGQLRDYSPRTGYVVYNSENKEVIFRRLDYKNKETKKKIKQIKELKVEYASRLSLGV